MSEMEHWCGSAYKVVGTPPARALETLENAGVDVIDDPHVGIGASTWGNAMEFVAVQRSVSLREVSDRLKTLLGVELDLSEGRTFNFWFYNGGDNPLWNTTWDDFFTKIPDTGDRITAWDGVRLDGAGSTPKP